MAMSPVLRNMRLLQFGDSVLPVGSFSFSNALESAVERGVVHDIDTLREWVGTATRQAASGDAIGLLHAHRATCRGDIDGVIAADQAVLERKLNEEARTMSTRMGRKLGELGERVVRDARVDGWLGAVRDGRAPGSFPVGMGVVFAALGADEMDAFAAHQYGVASMILGAALRIMRVDHMDTQTILFGVDAAAPDAYASIRDAALDDMSAFAPMTDILAAVHASAHVRMFMS
jgi:urease accessory protein